MWHVQLGGSLKARIHNLAAANNRESCGVMKGQNHCLVAVKLLKENPWKHFYWQ